MLNLTNPIITLKTITSKMNEISVNPMKFIEIDKLIPSNSNPRTHNDEQIDQIANSFQEFGFVNPIVVDKDYNVIAGHGRLLAAKKIALKYVPCIVVEHFTNPQKRGYLIADNQIALNASWDDDLLDEELKKLALEDFELGLLGFEDDFLKNIIDDSPGYHAGEDDVGEILDSDSVITQKGDIWLLGEHRVMCGSSTDKSDVNHLIGDRNPFIMITDPPYGVSYDAGWRADQKYFVSRKIIEGSNCQKADPIQNDDICDWTEAFSLFGGDVAYVWHAAMNGDVFKKSLIGSGFELKSHIVWVKNVHALSRSHYHWKHEPCWYAIRSKASHHWKGDRTQNTVWKCGYAYYQTMREEGQKFAHPTQKPAYLYVKAINNHCIAGDFLYDPFGGSGTAVIAAEQTSTKCLLMEIYEKYVDLIVKRWQDYTGKEAVHADTGNSFNFIKEKDCNE